MPLLAGWCGQRTHLAMVINSPVWLKWLASCCWHNNVRLRFPVLALPSKAAIKGFLKVCSSSSRLLQVIIAFAVKHTHMPPVKAMSCVKFRRRHLKILETLGKIKATKRNKIYFKESLAEQIIFLSRSDHVDFPAKYKAVEHFCACHMLPSLEATTVPAKAAAAASKWQGVWRGKAQEQQQQL